MQSTDVKFPPSTLGSDFCFSRWGEQLKSNVIQTETEDGTVLIRRRFSNEIRFAEVSVNLKRSVYSDFMTFFQTDLKDGLLPFWVHEPQGVTHAWRATSVPRITWIGTGAEAFRLDWTIMRNKAWP